MDKSITVIISHYAPFNNTNKYQNLLLNTIRSIHSQNINFDIEIIVCDDGSAWSSSLSGGNNVEIFDLDNLRSIPILKDLGIDKYLYLADKGKYQGAILKDIAIRNAKYENIVILDDDHPFISTLSLARYSKLFNKYSFIRGRIIGPDGRPQLFMSNNAQGTNYGIKKQLYLNVNGYADYIYKNAYGEDNDILIRIYNEYKKTMSSNFACYAGEIVTKDLASNRWLDRSNSGITDSSNIESPYKRQPFFIQDFIKEYQIHPYKGNPSRYKILWLKIPSIRSLVSEIKYIFIYLYHLPLIAKNKIMKFIKIGIYE